MKEMIETTKCENKFIACTRAQDCGSSTSLTLKRPVEGVYFIPEPKGQGMVHTNDVFVYDKGLIYIRDRLEGGLDILRRTR
jgi:hypothetical protein